MNEFLNLIEESRLIEAYTWLSNPDNKSLNPKVIDQFKQILTSHFIRNRQGKLQGLISLRNAGFTPSIVFDVGAQVGTPELFQAFPDAHHIMIEPVAECLSSLNSIKNELKSAIVINCAVSNINGSATLSMTPSRQYSSIEGIIGEENREIEVRTLDSIYEDISIDGPILIKIDVDGPEIKVLQGAKSILKKDCVLVIEASIADENPRFANIVEYMTAYGYQVYDIVDHLHRQGDFHLWQVDLIFIKNKAKFWGSKSFW